jgi:hypothetical protein
VAHPDRNGGGGLSVRTLAIASAASLTAAIVVSRLFPPGTIYASALTPVIVAAVSEILNRPADRVSEFRRQRRTMVMEAARAPQGEEAGALRGAPDFAQGADAEQELAVTGNGTGAPPIRIHGRSRSRVLHPKVWIATGLAAFAIAVAVVTLPELIFGGAVANNHRTTIFGGGGSSSTKTQTTETKTDTQPQQTVTETTPAQTPAQQTETQTTTTETQTTPTETQTTPTDTATTPTETTTTPGGAAVPPTP